MSSKIKRAISAYFDLGFTAIPVELRFEKNSKGVLKKKLIKPFKWQSGEIKKSLAINLIEDRHNGVALLTGEKHNLIVVDDDTAKYDDVKTFSDWMDDYDFVIDPNTPQVNTISNGRHYYFKYPENKLIGGSNRVNFVKGIDIRGDGGIIFAPPTELDGKKYEFIGNSKHFLTRLPEMPEKLIDLINDHTQKPTEKRDFQIPDSEKFTGVRDACEHLRRFKLNYDEWIKCGMALSEMGEDGRGFWFLISDNDFYKDTTDMLNWKFDDFLKNTKNVSIASLFGIAKKYGFKPKIPDKLPEAPSNKGGDVKPIVKPIKMIDVIENAKKLEMPEKMLGSFMFEHQIGIFFSITSVGKSTVAWQICDAISSGRKNKLNLETPDIGVKTAYIDLETSAYTIKVGYSKANPSDNFFYYTREDYYKYLKERNFDIGLESMLKFIEEIIVITGAKFIVLDNISIFSNFDQQKAKDATLLTNQLIDFRNNYDITFMIIAHTPKLAPYEPVQLSHLAGSAQLSNLIDFVFTIGMSQQSKSYRYLKQLKQRFDGIKYGENNILLYDYAETPFRHIRFLKFDEESNHTGLVKLSKNDKEIMRIMRENGNSISAYELWERSDHFRKISKKAAENALRRFEKKLEFVYKDDSHRYFIEDTQ